MLNAPPTLDRSSPMSTPLPPSPAVAAPSESLVTITHVVYALHTLGLVVGAFGTASVIGMFLFGWPSIIAVIINYVKRSDVRGTYLDSHFSWQIRTFWWAMLFAVTIAVVGFVLLPLLGFGLVVWWIGFLALGIWAIYRIARGWLALKTDGRCRPLPLDHQIEICSLAARIIGAPAGQLNACANAGTLASGPSTR